MTDKKKKEDESLALVQKIQLTFPVTHEDKTFKELSMRRPNIRDHIWLDHKKKASKKESEDKEAFGDAEEDATLYARLCDVDIAVIQSLDMKDWGKLRDWYLTCVGS